MFSFLLFVFFCFFQLFADSPEENGGLFIRRTYLNELSPLGQNYCLGSYHEDVVKIKEWLIFWQILQSFFSDKITLNPLFDEKTESVLKIVQKFMGLPVTGNVDQETWRHLTAPLKSAFAFENKDNLSLKELFCLYALKHLQYRSCELLNENRGPWVRSYMKGGYDGEKAYWCQAFVSTILDQTFSTWGECFSEYYPNTDTCETFRRGARSRGLLLTEHQLRSHQYVPQAGDIVLYILGNDTEAHHTEIVYKVLNKNSGRMITLGGNTNLVGNRNGVALFFVERNFLSDKGRRMEIVKMIDTDCFEEHKTYPLGVRQLMCSYPQLVGYQNKKIFFEEGFLFYESFQGRNRKQGVKSFSLKEQYSFSQQHKDGSLEMSQRICEPFFKKLYGSSRWTVEKRLKSIVWCPSLCGKVLRMTSTNDVAFKLKLLSTRLDKILGWKDCLSSVGRSYEWERMGRDGRLSTHSFGISLDFAFPYSQMPKKLIALFAEYGFVCFGKKNGEHCHFEYRPEMILQRS